jgi:hypothetical protein
VVLDIRFMGFYMVEIIFSSEEIFFKWELFESGPKRSVNVSL